MSNFLKAATILFQVTAPLNHQKVFTIIAALRKYSDLLQLGRLVLRLRYCRQIMFFVYNWADSRLQQLLGFSFGLRSGGIAPT